MSTLLKAQHLDVRFGNKVVVLDANFELLAGKTLAIVGETGSGKSICALSLMRLAELEGARVKGSVLLTTKQGPVVDLYSLPPRRARDYLGSEIGIVFQEPLTALNPVLRVGDQIEEVLRRHRGMSHRQARAEAVSMMDMVWIPEARRRARSYPHELSGGMRQRVMIAMAMAARPQVLIADEPTTALDVTVQEQILALLIELQDTFGTGLLFISHDMAVVAELADEVMVMQHGRTVEQGPTSEVINNPKEEYTSRLLGLVPKVGDMRGVDGPRLFARDEPRCPAPQHHG